MSSRRGRLSWLSGRLVSRRGRRDPQPSSSAIPAADVVAVIYSLVLGRSPDPEGLAHYTARLENGNASADDVASALFSSGEVVSGVSRSPATRALRRVLWNMHAATPLKGAPVYALHIMKTGGTSLVEGMRNLASPRACLTEIFLDDLVSVPSYVLEHVPLVAGHFGYEGRKLLPSRFVTCVVLRDPVERTLSHYAHLRRDPEVMAEHPHLTLDDFLHSPRWRTLSNNYQARQLVHEVRLDRTWIDFSPEEEFQRLGPPFPREHPLPLQSLFDCSPLQFEPEELLVRALERLDAIEFVGVTEHLDGLFAKLARSWGVDRASRLPTLQVGHGRPRADDIPRRLIETIREETAVDTVLYERARKLQREREAASR